ncbi:uncharacterized protein Z518_09630 [Rhinocladiella mackenziei CBS 650.93]|uniref:Uncharacterized protein n=1 Tax=Rhinocladiella mackenziei CBS 650.93 TaxID=1442369 RepID=A0A0D2IV34_9EURO|nr:uncharacterized protein Z518_09630 [Rhinocladiella mackenziei CBS 650.93]KIX00565.1 hypothetical protein Z518_09630 [Rhinocladiella mackenziei CBS 650.93]
MASPYPLTTDEMCDTFGDLHTICLQDSNVPHLPGSRPIDDACPVKDCQRRMNRSTQSSHPVILYTALTELVAVGPGYGEKLPVSGVAVAVHIRSPAEE